MNTSLSKHDLYLKAYRKTIKELLLDPTNTLLIKRAVLYGVRIVNSKPENKVITKEEAIRDFQFAEIIKVFMGSLTPVDFENIFPITKVYDGDRNQCKDYFYTKDFMRTLPADKTISDVIKISELLWDYTNEEVREFLINSLGYLDNLLRLDGKPGMLELYCSENGLDYYYLYADCNGKQYMVDPKTGKSSKVKIRKPRYLKVVK